jgi:hypothetical protein
MMFWRRLFSRKEKPAAEQPRGSFAQQTQAEQDATRKRMEAELAADRERRGATDVRPGGEQPPGQDSERAPTGDT